MPKRKLCAISGPIRDRVRTRSMIDRERSRDTPTPNRPALPISFERVRAHALIDKERDAQDKQWGGPDHDDHHNVRDWINFINKQATLIRPEDPSRFIKIAALAVAAWESIQRKKEHEREHPNRSNHA